MNIVQSGNRSWKYKVSHRRYWLAFKACQGSQGQLTLLDGAAPGLSVDFALAVRSCVFCACVESCWLQPVKSKVTQLKLTDPSASSIHFALPMESVYNIQTPVHLSLDNAPIWFGCSKLADGAALWKIIHPKQFVLTSCTASLASSGREQYNVTICYRWVPSCSHAQGCKPKRCDERPLATPLVDHFRRSRTLAHQDASKCGFMIK